MPKRRRKKNKSSLASKVVLGLFFLMFLVFAGYVVAENFKKNEEMSKTEEKTIDSEPIKKVESKVAVKDNSVKLAEPKDVGGADAKTEEEIEKEAAGETVNGYKLTKTYQNPEYNYAVNYPETWETKTLEANRVGLLPTAKKSLKEYEGDVVLSLKKNEKNLSVEKFYDGSNDINLFTDAAKGVKQITVAGRKAYRFNGVEGYAPANVVVVPLGKSFLEITDMGAQHEKDGLFESLVNTLKIN